MIEVFYLLILDTNSKVIKGIRCMDYPTLEEIESELRKYNSIVTAKVEKRYVMKYNLGVNDKIK